MLGPPPVPCEDRPAVTFARGAIVTGGFFMALTTTPKKRDGVTVVYCRGAIVLGEESTTLRTFVKALLNQTRQLVLDLGDVTRIDSGGLGTLVGLYTSARNAGGNIKLANLGSRVNEVLQVTKLVTVFDVFDKTEDAVASFKKASAAK
jgi:anti-sigma B factor antagonist